MPAKPSPPSPANLNTIERSWRTACRELDELQQVRMEQERQAAQDAIIRLAAERHRQQRLATAPTGIGSVSSTAAAQAENPPSSSHSSSGGR